MAASKCFNQKLPIKPGLFHMSNYNETNNKFNEKWMIKE